MIAFLQPVVPIIRRITLLDSFSDPGIQKPDRASTDAGKTHWGGYLAAEMRPSGRAVYLLGRRREHKASHLPRCGAE